MARLSKRKRALVHDLLKVSGPVEWVETRSRYRCGDRRFGQWPGLCLLSRRVHGGGRPQSRSAGGPRHASCAGNRRRGLVNLLHQSPDDASRLRQNVTSPGGTTAAALAVLMAEDGMQPLVRQGDRRSAQARRRTGRLIDHGRADHFCRFREGRYPRWHHHRGISLSGGAQAGLQAGDRFRTRDRPQEILRADHGALHARKR